MGCTRLNYNYQMAKEAEEIILTNVENPDDKMLM